MTCLLINIWLAATFLVPLQPRVLLRVLRAEPAARLPPCYGCVVWWMSSARRAVPWPAKLATRRGLGS